MNTELPVKAVRPQVSMVPAVKVMKPAANMVVPAKVAASTAEAAKEAGAKRGTG